MSNADPRGKFVWHELLSADAAAATAFYTKVVAWKSQPWEQDASYSMWVAKNGPVGGLASLDGAKVPHWLPYIAVDDLAGTVQSAKGLGGRVLKDKTDLPNGGSYAVLADPQGAEFAVYKAGAPHPASPAAGAGDFTWHELATSDAKAAMDFYTKLVGWQVGPVHDMGPGGNYHLFLHEGNQYGGIFASTTGGGPSWLCYIGVEDAGKAVAAAKSAGGRVLNGPMEVPGGSWVAQVLDPEGAPFAVHEPARTAVAAKPAKAPKPAASITKPPQAAAPAASITKPPQAAKPKPDASIDKPPQAAKPAASITKPPQTAKPAASVDKPPQVAKAKPAAKAAAKKGKKAPAKKAAAKKAPAKKKAAPAKKAAKKSAAKGKAKAAAKKGKKKSAARRAPAKKKASRAKAKKHR